MWELVVQAVSWLLMIFFGAQAITFVGLVLWTIWTDAIKPRLIPADDIAQVADDIIARYPDPELEAFARHERAWYESDGAKQTYWYRVRRVIQRKLALREIWLSAATPSSDKSVPTWLQPTALA